MPSGELIREVGNQNEDSPPTAEVTADHIYPHLRSLLHQGYFGNASERILGHVAWASEEGEIERLLTEYDVCQTMEEFQRFNPEEYNKIRILYPHLVAALESDPHLTFESRLLRILIHESSKQEIERLAEKVRYRE